MNTHRDTHIQDHTHTHNLSLSLNSGQRLYWHGKHMLTLGGPIKASEIYFKNNSKHYTHKSLKRLKTFQISYCEQIVKVQKGNK